MGDWKTATDRPGYRCKKVKHGSATITIYRPILTEVEAAEAHEKTRTALEYAMRDHYNRKARAAAV